jgi:hypothetical protein
MRDQYKVLQEAYERVTEDSKEVSQIINQARTITQGYIKLLKNKKVTGVQLGDYKQKNINPLISFICSYVNHSTPQELAKFRHYLTELLTTIWLEIDGQYWEEEMNKLVTGAVEYGEVNLDNLEDLAQQGNKHITEVVKPAKEEEVDPKELAKGIKVEMEHTDDPKEAKRIALQHLAEIKDYYSRLEKVEKK